MEWTFKERDIVRCIDGIYNVIPEGLYIVDRLRVIYYTDDDCDIYIDVINKRGKLFEWFLPSRFILDLEHTRNVIIDEILDYEY